METNNMRGKFETWFKSRWPNTEFSRFINGEYCEFSVHCGWQAWQASIDSVEIELPQQSGVNRAWNQAIRYCHQSIEAQGLRVRP